MLWNSHSTDIYQDGSPRTVLALKLRVGIPTNPSVPGKPGWFSHPRGRGTWAKVANLRPDSSRSPEGRGFGELACRRLESCGVKISQGLTGLGQHLGLHATVSRRPLVGIHWAGRPDVMWGPIQNTGLEGRRPLCSLLPASLPSPSSDGGCSPHRLPTLSSASPSSCLRQPPAFPGGLRRPCWCISTLRRAFLGRYLISKQAHNSYRFSALFSIIRMWIEDSSCVSTINPHSA